MKKILLVIFLLFPLTSACTELSDKEASEIFSSLANTVAVDVYINKQNQHAKYLFSNNYLDGYKEERRGVFGLSTSYRLTQKIKPYFIKELKQQDTLSGGSFKRIRLNIGNIKKIKTVRTFDLTENYKKAELQLSLDLNKLGEAFPVNNTLTVFIEYKKTNGEWKYSNFLWKEFHEVNQINKYDFMIAFENLKSRVTKQKSSTTTSKYSSSTTKICDVNGVWSEIYIIDPKYVKDSNDPFAPMTKEQFLNKFPIKLTGNDSYYAKLGDEIKIEPNGAIIGDLKLFSDNNLDDKDSESWKAKTWTCANNKLTFLNNKRSLSYELLNNSVLIFKKNGKGLVPTNYKIMVKYFNNINKQRTLQESLQFLVKHQALEYDIIQN